MTVEKLETMPQTEMDNRDEMTGVFAPMKCLDHGFVRLVDYMGDDSSIVQAARVSYGRGTKKRSDDRGLIRYLMRHSHTTPFEMVEFKFHVKLPIFVARQWIRHRTANVNEYSARYSVIEDEFYVPKPDQVLYQSASNKQGRGGEAPPEDLREDFRKTLELTQKQSYAEYQNYIDKNLTRELARIHLPVSVYTQWYWKIDLHNLFHFLRLRTDDHAQYEIRVYAEAMTEIVRQITPLAYEAFEDYTLNAVKLTKPELKLLQGALGAVECEDAEAEAAGLSRRELRELRAKLERIRLLK